VKKRINEKANEVKELLKKESTTADEFKKATDALGTAAQEMGKIVYEEAAKKEKGDQKKEGPVDAEVVDEKDQKNS
jgi:hypothetical protein